ncbi:MAG: xylulokinase [Spirochaetaceae bacterium]|jgi:xylulokinase|nr:xylulokinase [Spirochaetaceae bacterium]
MNETVAGVDMGTQSIKVVLYDWHSKNIIAQEKISVDMIADNDGTREQKTEWYDNALAQLFSRLSDADKKTIAAIGVSGHQHGFVPLDASGRALSNVKLWNDTSTVEECAIITESAGGEDAVIAEVCNLMLPGFTAPKILWLKRHKPQAYARLRFIMLPHDYINYCFTGEYRAEYGDCSGTALFNGAKRAWSAKICSIIDEGLMGLLPKLVESDEPHGFVHAKAAAAFGIPQGIPVSSGGGDNMMGAIGTGTVRDGFLTMSLGTSGTLFGYSERPIADPKNGISGFNSSTGGYLPLLCTMNCTVATEETRKLFGLGVKEFDSLAEEAKPGADGVVFIPFFNGERTPNLPQSRASILGLTAANIFQANIARAALEAAIFGLRGGFESFKALGFNAREIRITGGGAMSRLWRQMAADIMNLPVKRPVNEEGAAMGAAVQALWCLEKIRGGGGKPTGIQTLCDEHISLDEKESIMPDARNVEEYTKAYKEYTKYLNTLSVLYK